MNTVINIEEAREIQNYLFDNSFILLKAYIRNRMRWKRKMFKHSFFYEGSLVLTMESSNKIINITAYIEIIEKRNKAIILLPINLSKFESLSFLINKTLDFISLFDFKK